jgi:hypothetical protein
LGRAIPWVRLNADHTAAEILAENDPELGGVFSTLIKAKLPEGKPLSHPIFNPRPDPVGVFVVLT